MTAAFVGEVAGLLVFGTLLLSGAAHLRRLARFEAALAAQGIPSRCVRRAISTAVIAVELAVGGAGSAAAVVAEPVQLRFSALAAALLHAVFACYLYRLVRRLPGAPCGCGGGLKPANVWTAARAAALSLVSMLALLAGRRPGAYPPAYAALAALCAVGLGIALWQMPDATAGRRQ
ncbi:MAG: MauE/DoxX family redox-associated membrane protein [Egibacteraceae bacterium]